MMIALMKNTLTICIIVNSLIFCQNIDYVRYLLSQSENTIARTELYKLVYLTRDIVTSDIYRFTIGYSYQLEGNEKKALEIYQNILLNDDQHTPGFIDTIKFNISLALLELHKYNEALSIINHVNNQLVHDLKYKIHVITAEKNPLPSEYFSRHELASFNQLQSSLKNPNVAAFFSFIFPGAGQLYSNHYADGIQALFVVGVGMLFSAISIDAYQNEKSGIIIPSLTVGTTILFHYANILSGYRTAIYRNMKIKEQYIQNELIYIKPLNPLNLLKQ